MGAGGSVRVNLCHHVVHVVHQVLVGSVHVVLLLVIVFFLLLVLMILLMAVGSVIIVVNGVETVIVGIGW